MDGFLGRRYCPRFAAASKSNDLTIFLSIAGIELVPLSLFTGKRVVTVDKPFIFIVRDRQERVPLFVGKIVDPTQ